MDKFGIYFGAFLGVILGPKSDSKFKKKQISWVQMFDIFVLFLELFGCVLGALLLSS